MGLRFRSSSDRIALSIVAKNFAVSSPGAGAKSPASWKSASASSTPLSVEEFDDSEDRALRMSGGACAAPRWKEEFSSERNPTRARRGSLPPSAGIDVPLHAHDR